MLRFCNRPGCPNKVARGYCKACQARRAALTVDHISRPTDRVLPPPKYGREWQRRSKRFLADHPFCIDCVAEGRPTGLATEVDHETPHEGDRVKFWDETNWRPRCKSHHSRKTAREMSLGGLWS